MRALHPTIAAALPRAATVLADRGLDGTGMEDIVRVTIVPRPTLDDHCSSEKEILAWLLDRPLIELSVDIGEVLGRDEPAAGRLDAVISNDLARSDEHCAVRRAAHRAGSHHSDPEFAHATRAAFHEPVRKLLDAGALHGSLRKVDGELAASAIFGAVTTVGSHKVVTHQPVKREQHAVSPGTGHASRHRTHRPRHPNDGAPEPADRTARLAEQGHATCNASARSLADAEGEAA